MQNSIRYIKALGDAEVYFRLPGKDANVGKFRDFVALTWVTPETADCRKFATEYADDDPYESWYSVDITIPAGGPYIIEAVLISTGESIGAESTALDEIMSSRAVESTVAKEATLAHATYGLSALQVLLDAIDTSTELQARFTEIKGAGWTTETLKAIKEFVDDIESKTNDLNFETVNGISCVKAAEQFPKTLTVATDVNNSTIQFKISEAYASGALEGGWIKFVTGELAGLPPKRVTSNNGTTFIVYLTANLSVIPAVGDVAVLINS